MDNYGDLHQVGHEAGKEGGRGGRGGGGGESILPASLPVPSDRGGGCEEGSLGKGGGGEKTLVFSVLNLFDLNTCNATPKCSNYSQFKYDCVSILVTG